MFAAAAAVYNGLAATAAAWGPLGAAIGRRSAYERRQQLQAEMVALVGQRGGGRVWWRCG